MKILKCISFIWKLFSLVLLINLSSAAPEVTIAQGRLQGKTVISERGFGWDAFMWIPYAKPPVGDLRFKDPQPADGWEGIRSATAEGNVCPQMAQSSFIGNEDCLYLNVFVPQNTSVGSNLPSIVWIHGGSYISGSGSTSFNGLDNLMDKDVIIVTINYRLGPLGFLCLHSADVPGNAGMQDQVLALKWVQENIGQFGGDAYQVTIFGESAGGSSVHFLMMSPATNGLFSKAIMDSGTSISEWALQPNPVEIAVKLGRLFSLDTENKTVLFNLFKTLPASLLIPVSLLVEPSTNALAYTPVIEELHRPNSFLEDDPMELLRSARYNVVPTISGFMSNEGAFFGTYFTGVDLSTLTLDILIPNFEIYIPKDLKDKLDADAVKETAEKIKQFYFETEDNLMERYFTFWTDYAYVKDIDVSTKFLAQYDPRTYYFKFSYSGTYNYIRLFTPIPYEGAAHADELGYIFNYPKGTFVEQPTETDDRIVKQMAEMWTNFAKFGNPTPTLSDNIKVIWEPVSSRAVNCLDINNNTVLIQNPYKDRAQFWQDLYLIK